MFANKDISELKKNTEGGDPDALFNLGILYIEGKVSYFFKYQNAAKCFEKAADKGHLEAQLSLGSLYIEGKGVEQDDEKATEYFKMAAEGGLAGAQYLYALLLIYDLKPNYFSQIESYKAAIPWFKKAAKQGVVEAVDELHKIYIKFSDRVGADLKGEFSSAISGKITKGNQKVLNEICGFLADLKQEGYRQRAEKKAREDSGISFGLECMS